MLLLKCWSFSHASVLMERDLKNEQFKNSGNREDVDFCERLKLLGKTGSKLVVIGYVPIILFLFQYFS